MSQRMFELDSERTLLTELQFDPKSFSLDAPTSLYTHHIRLYNAANTLAESYSQAAANPNQRLSNAAFLTGVSAVYLALQNSDLEQNDMSHIEARTPHFFDLVNKELSKHHPIHQVRSMYTLTKTGLMQHPELRDHTYVIESYFMLMDGNGIRATASTNGIGLCALLMDEAYKEKLGELVDTLIPKQNIDWDEAFIDHFGN